MFDKQIDHVIDRVLDRLVPIVENRLDAVTQQALALITAELPKLAATVAESAIKSIFEHSSIDEAANTVSDTINEIFNRLPFGLGR
jgi:uncharacterized protein YgbK (DUF1537 family)